jgi:FkbM family methyltransferase
MPRARDWVGSMLLRAPESVRSLRNVPLLGGLIHGLSHRIVPTDEKVWVRVEIGPAKGLWLELNPRTGQAYMRGEAEVAVQEFLAARLRPDDVFYDLGANIGLFTLLGARAVGAGGKVFSFEPDSQNAARLRRNVSRNNFANVSVVEAGVWSSSGEQRFAAADANSPDRGVGTFVAEKAGASDVVVRSVSLDDFVQSAPLPTAIKCDVEGAEFEVFLGARALLLRQRPWILCEMHSEENDRRVRGVLAAHGYAFENIDDMHVFATP